MYKIENYFGPAFQTVDVSLKTNAETLLRLVNSLFAEIPTIDATKHPQTSGYRTPEHNAAIGGSKNSNHCKALAIDLLDNGRELGNYLFVNQNLLKKRNMAMEALESCVTKDGKQKWVHLQAVLPPSGSIVFKP